MLRQKTFGKDPKAEQVGFDYFPGSQRQNRTAEACLGPWSREVGNLGRSVYTDNTGGGQTQSRDLGQGIRNGSTAGRSGEPHE